MSKTKVVLFGLWAYWLWHRQSGGKKIGYRGGWGN